VATVNTIMHTFADIIMGIKARATAVPAAMNTLQKGVS
jgi:hypothetical protein